MRRISDNFKVRRDNLQVREWRGGKRFYTTLLRKFGKRENE